MLTRIFPPIILLISLAFLLPSPTFAAEESWQDEECSPARIDPEYRQITALAAATQRTLLAGLPAPRQSRLWRAQLCTYLEEHPALTTEQRDLIREALKLLKPSLFQASRRERRKQEPIFENLLNRFQKDLGETAPALLLVLGRVAPPTAAADEEGQALIGTGRPCDCNLGGSSNWCSWSPWRDAFCSSRRCREDSTGCGFLGLYPCNGLCEDLDPLPI